MEAEYKPNDEVAGEEAIVIGVWHADGTPYPTLIIPNEWSKTPWPLF